MTINCSAPGHIPVGRPKPRALEKRKRSDERTGTGGPIKWPCTARGRGMQDRLRAAGGPWAYVCQMKHMRFMHLSGDKNPMRPRTDLGEGKEWDQERKLKKDYEKYDDESNLSFIAQTWPTQQQQNRFYGTKQHPDSSPVWKTRIQRRI